MKQSTMKSFYMGTRPRLNDSHSVHVEGCPFLPDENKRIFLGKFVSLNDARHEGDKYFHNNCGCRFCTKDTPGVKESAGNINEDLMDLRSTGLLKFLN